MKRFVIALSVAVAVGRVFIAPRLVSIPSVEGTFESIAHLFVGFLILVPFYDPEKRLGPSKMYGWLGWLLALWEAAWFLIQKAHAS